MDSKVFVDLAFSDDSDSELLSLHERILKGKKPDKNQHDNKKITLSPVKRKAQRMETVSESEDSDGETSLPSLKDLVGINHPVSSTEKKIKIRESDTCFSYHRSDVLGLRFKVDMPDEEVPTLKKNTIIKKNVNDVKEAAREEKKRLREEKKQQKELEKALKASIKEVQKGQKPEELLKSMKVILDHKIILEKQSEDIFSALDEWNLKYSVEENPVEKSILWCRMIKNVNVENNQVVTEEHENLENTLVLFVPSENFIRLTYAYIQKSKGSSLYEPTLLDHIVSIKVLFPQVEITCAVVGLDHYIKSLKESEATDLELKRMAKHVTKAVIEEVTIEIQLQAFVNFNFLSNMTELGEMLARYSKAIAEAPLKKEKQLQKSLAFSWYADADSSCPVKLEKDGASFIKLWQQQIKQFNNVGPEVAEAVSAKYSSLHSLLQAYRSCSTVKEAETLLQDIVVRRSYGPLGSQKRLGPELSYKMYLFFNSRDGNQILQR